MLLKLISFGIMLLLTSAIFGQTASNKELQVKLVFMLGSVQYKPNFHAKEWKKATLNMTFSQAASLRTGKGSLAMLVINDEIKIKISGMTTMEFEKLQDEKMLQIYTGKIWSKVSKQEGKSHFAVRSPSSVIGVRGTEFIFETTQQEDKLYVSEGKVAISKPEEPKKIIEVSSGEIASLKKDKKQERQIEVKQASYDDIKSLKNEFDIKDIKKIPFYNASVEENWNWEKTK